jgi:hypothetical protein
VIGQSWSVELLTADGRDKYEDLATEMVAYPDSTVAIAWTPSVALGKHAYVIRIIGHLSPSYPDSYTRIESTTDPLLFV